MTMIEYIEDSEEISTKPMLQLSGLACKDVLNSLDIKAADKFSGVEVAMLSDDLDIELAEGLLDFCSAVSAGGTCLNVVHTDLGSGTDCEQRLFELIGERSMRETEKTWSEKLKRDSSKEKDFAAAAEKRRKGQAGVEVAVARLAEIDQDMAKLEMQKLQTSWYALFSQIQAVPRNSIKEIDLSNCGLHATGLGFLTTVLLDLENRAEGSKVRWLALDGNDLTDIGMGVLASFLRLSKDIEGLQVRNVGITEQGIANLVSGLVTNRSLRLLDVRQNGLCDLDAAQSAIAGVQRFNPAVEILLT